MKPPFRRDLDAVAIGTMVAMTALWAFQQVSLKWVAQDATPTTMMAWRSAIAALLVAALMAWQRQPMQLASGRWKPGLLVALMFGVEFLLIGESLRRTHASHTVVLLYTAPIFSAVGLALKLPEERLAPAQWLGLALAFVGIAIAFLGRTPTAGAPADATMLLGDLFGLLAGLAWGLTTVVVRLTRLSNAPAAETLLYQLLGAAVIITVAAAFSGQLHARPTPAFILHLGLQAVLISFVSYLVWFALLRRYRAAPLGVMTFLTPILGVVFGIALLGERLHPAFAAGGTLVLVGVALVGGWGWWQSRRERVR